jgi:hypothetical protein
VRSDAFTLSESEERDNGKLGEKIIFVIVLQDEIWKTRIKGKRKRNGKEHLKKTDLLRTRRQFYGLNKH